MTTQARRLLLAFLVSAPAWGQTVALKGRVLDSSAALIPGASVTAYQGESPAGTTQTGSSGAFELALPPGEYLLEVTAPDFATYSTTVTVKPGMADLSVTLELAPVAQSVQVEDEGEAIQLEPDQNLTGLVLTEEDIQELPEDEEELAEILREMAGPGADAVGGAEFIVDGFTGGQLPPRDQIQEIRINSNPFSAEYSRPGRGRIEIRTRAGADRLRGNVNFNFRDDALNARNAFADTKPPYQRRDWRANLSGPVLRDRMSFNFSARRSDAADSDTISAITPDGPFSDAIVHPSVRQNFSGRTQYQLSENHSLNFNVRYSSRNQENQGVGGFTLPERAFASESRDWEFQVRDTATLSQTAVNEFRFELKRDRSSSTPLTRDVAIDVLDAFESGGADNRSEQKERSYEFTDMLLLSAGKATLKVGLQGNYHQERTLSEANFLGTFVFSSLEAFENGLPTTFSINRGDPRLDVNQMEWAAFLQNDWRVTPKFTLSLGTRFEAQTNISDKNNFDPRLGIAYGATRSTVIRGGFGLFHQRLSLGTLQSLLRLDGTRQQQIVIRNPSYPDPFAGAGVEEIILPSSVRDRARDLALPYTLNASLSVEQRLPKGLSLAVGYDFIRGVHLYRSRNINAPLPGETVRPDPERGNILLLESTGLSRYHELSVRVRQRIRNFTVFATYTYAFSSNDSNGAFSLPANNYDLASEWGRAPNDRRHTTFTGVNFQLPWDLRAGTMIRANSPVPFNITTGFDDNGDTFSNDRPAGVARNSGQGPGFFSLNLRLTKTIQLRSRDLGLNGREGGRPGNAGDSPAPPGGVGRMGRPGGPRGGGGFGGGRGGGGDRSGPSMSLFANLNNLLNRTNFTRFSGVLTSPFFGEPNSARNPREIEMGVRFNF